MAIQPITSVILAQTYKCTLTETHTRTHARVSCSSQEHSDISVRQDRVRKQSQIVKNLSYCSVINIFDKKQRFLLNNYMFFVVFSLLKQYMFKDIYKKNTFFSQNEDCIKLMSGTVLGSCDQGSTHKVTQPGTLFWKMQ